MTDILNRLYYYWRRNNWMLDPRRYWSSSDDVEIDRPIFLLGVQGGGLTLVSRILRRNCRVVTVTGNCRYWTGADEMQNVLGPILPAQLTGIRHKAPADDVFGTPRGWLYATERLLPRYRHTEADATERLEKQFRQTLRWVIKRNARDPQSARFLDKSQLYTVKIRFLHHLLADTDPKFVLIARNPYALCYRSAQGKAYSLKRLEQRYDFDQRLDLAAQHWGNSMRCALEDLRKLDTGMIVQFEEILQDPERMVPAICEFAELDYDPDMLPQPDHKIPFGTRFQERWHPLNSDVNTRYLNDIQKRHVRIIEAHCEPYAEELGYERPLADSPSC